MKKVFINLISICLFICYSCQQDKSGLSSSFCKVELKKKTEDLLNVYLNTYPKLSKDKFGLRLGIQDYNDDHFVVFLSNFYLDKDGHQKQYEKEWSVAKHEGFRIYIYDDQKMFISTTNQKVQIQYERSEDSIIPTTYGGNLWEIHFKKRNITEMHFVPKDAKVKIAEIFEQPNGN